MYAVICTICGTVTQCIPTMHLIWQVKAHKKNQNKTKTHKEFLLLLLSSSSQRIFDITGTAFQTCPRCNKNLRQTLNNEKVFTPLQIIPEVNKVVLRAIVSSTCLFPLEIAGHLVCVCVWTIIWENRNQSSNFKESCFFLELLPVYFVDQQLSLPRVLPFCFHVTKMYANLQLKVCYFACLQR